MQVFNEIAQKKRLSKKKGLSLDVSTRWNSTYDMLKSALVYKDVFMMYVQEHGPSTLTLTHDDWKKAECICKYLKYFADATKIFSGFKYPTSNLYFKEVWNIRGLLLEEANNQYETIRNLALEMQLKFDKYWRHCNKFLCVASVLDPRFKLGYIAFSYENAFGEDDGKRRVDVIKELLNDIYVLYEKATNEKGSSINVALEGNLQGSNSLVASGSKRKHDEAYMQWLSRQQVSKKPKRTEIICYLEEPSFGLMEDEDFNLLGWWKNNASIYPILANMAKDFLAVPVSSVSSESAFSTGGRVIDQHRTRLAPDTIEALICAQDWLNQDFNLDEDALSCITVVAEELDSDSIDQANEDE